MGDHEQNESFEAFRKSLSYGSRNDLNFKFFKGMSDEQVASFLQDARTRCTPTPQLVRGRSVHTARESHRQLDSRHAHNVWPLRRR